MGMKPHYLHAMGCVLPCGVKKVKKVSERNVTHQTNNLMVSFPFVFTSRVKLQM